MTLLKNTVRSIIETHEPAVICFCEVGESSKPLSAELEVDIVDIHLASGKPKLTDAARKGVLENMMRRKSSIHDDSIGQSHSFILGGDMNT